MKLGKIANGAKKRIIRIGTSVATVTALAIPAFAAEPTALDTALNTGLSGVQTSVMGTIGSVLPYALGIVGAVFGVKYGIRFFKSIAKG